MLIPFESIEKSRDLWTFRAQYIPTEKIGNGHTLVCDGVRYTVTQEQQGEVTLRRSILKNETDAPVAVDVPNTVFAFQAGEYEVYTQASIQLAEGQGQWQPLVTQIGAYADSIRTSRGATPFLAMWNLQTQRGYAFHVLTDSTWSLTANRHYAPSGYYAVQVRVNFFEPPTLTLQPGEELELPKVLFYPFRNKLDMDCWKLHRWYQDTCGKATLPLAYNTWLYRMDRFTPADIEKQIPVAAELGLEYFVVDAGWFGIKGSWFATAGDWEELPESAMGGRLADIAQQVRAAGMKFGLWFEIERGGKESKVIHEKPELFAQGPFNKMLDFGRREVRDHANKILDEKIAKYGIEYIKFDLNSDLCTIPGDPNLTRYFAGYRTFLQQLRERHPGIYLEVCASGGMRFDLTNALHFESCWLSDNQSPVHTMRIFKDAVRRLPPQFIERWVVAMQTPMDPFYGEKLLAPRSCDWGGMSSISPTWIECMLLGCTPGFSCDIASFTQETKDRFKAVLDEIKRDREFWRTCECRILCDTEKQLVLQYNDRELDRVEITAYNLVLREQHFHQFCPVLDESANYRYGEEILSGKELAELGMTLPTSSCYTAKHITLTKV